MKENRITAQMVLDNAKCGDYHGYRGGVKFNAEETSFGMYMYMIENTLNLWSKRNSREINGAAIQAQIDMVVGILENYILNLIDKKSLEITVDAGAFQDAFRNFNVDGVNLKDNCLLIPYVAQYILMQKGLHFKNEDVLLDSLDNSHIKQELVEGRYVNVDSTKQSVEFRRADSDQL